MPLRPWLLALPLCLLGCQSDPSPASSAATATAAPTASTAPASTSSTAPSGGLNQARVDAVIEGQVAALRERCLPDGAGDAGVELSLIAEVAADGTVKDVAVAGGGAAMKPLRACVEKAARGWTFGPGAGGEVTGVITLSP